MPQKLQPYSFNFRVHTIAASSFFEWCLALNAAIHLFVSCHALNDKESTFATCRWSLPICLPPKQYILLPHRIAAVDRWRSGDFHQLRNLIVATASTVGTLLTSCTSRYWSPMTACYWSLPSQRSAMAARDILMILLFTAPFKSVHFKSLHPESIHGWRLALFWRKSDLDGYLYWLLRFISRMACIDSLTSKMTHKNRPPYAAVFK